ncbi:MAG TPA: tRNA uridine-5-carboxymethylaminomethyl(34) synthesis GTPase MnmE, partial [Rhizomicrobium sp.]|nr:tRNA uridine-5-carboxymethylaminomethyl(34) synthesis GTPase MnmE [Rhizomicrobium sp.]
MSGAATSQETIYALSSAPGRAGVAVIRVSGPAAGAALAALAGSAPVPARKAVLRVLRGGDGAAIDRALVLWLPGPGSFSGEDMAEFQCHGGRAVVEAVLEALAAVPGLRPAEPGEFTRRAVENGRLDLTQAEAIADLVDAETGAQRRQALRQYEGALANLYEDWRTRLIRASAYAEAEIDFSEEEIPDGLAAQSRAAIAGIAGEIEAHLADGHRGERVREGLHLTVLGLPNAGKSSLLNALAKRDVAIVTETPGTTRDVIEVHLDLGGYAVIVADTAGLRQTDEAIEAEGVRRALARAQSADLVLLLLDGTAADPYDGLPDGVAQRAHLTVWNKADLPWPERREGLAISAKSGEGLAALIDTIAQRVRLLLDESGTPPLTRPRHRHALGQALAALRRSLATDEAELAAEDLRLAVRAIGRIT